MLLETINCEKMRCIRRMSPPSRDSLVPFSEALLNTRKVNCFANVVESAKEDYHKFVHD